MNKKSKRRTNNSVKNALLAIGLIAVGVLIAALSGDGTFLLFAFIVTISMLLIKD